jgi:hypothetical protein
MFLHESATEWYEKYQHMLELSEDLGGGIVLEDDSEDE